MNKQKIIDMLQKNMAWVLLFVFCIIFSFSTENFFSLKNILNILNQSSYVIVCGLGIALIMMAGELDLSVGYMMSVVGIVSAKLLSEFNIPGIVVVLVAIAIGIALSEVNTVLARVLKLERFMVTFGTMTIFQGLAFEISQSKATKIADPIIKFLGQGKIGMIPVPIIIALVCLIVVSFLVNKTYFGRYMFALGGNVDAAYLAGINVNRMRLAIGAIAGASVGLSALMLIGRMGSASATAGPGTEFTIITGVLLGGVSIRGGEGKVSSVVAGILILQILANGMQMAGLGIYAQYIVKGLIMLAAIGFDVFQLNRRNKANKAIKEAKAG